MGLPVEVKHDFEGGIISIFYHLTFSTEKIPILATGKMAIINRFDSEFGHRVSIIKYIANRNWYSLFKHKNDQKFHSISMAAGVRVG